MRVFELMEPKEFTAVPVVLMQDDDRVGMMNIYLARAARLLLKFTASEASEVITSWWCICMLPFYYYGPNKHFMYTIDVLDEKAFWDKILYSLTDFALEIITFMSLLYLFHRHVRINTFSVGYMYLEMKMLFLPILTISCTITIASFTFFLKHFGMDPSFKWDEYSTSVATVAQAAATNFSKSLMCGGEGLN